MRLSGEAKLGIGVAIVLAVVFATGPPWWFKYIHASASAAPRVQAVGMSGGCAPFQVFAQNRWDPIGTSVRMQPNILSDKNGSFAPNESISVDGWVHGRPAYPTNPAPWNSDIWYHLTDGAGWVSFAGVRASPTGYDPTGLSSDGGPAVAVSASCEGAVQ
jgi:hypothetical protein